MPAYILYINHLNHHNSCDVEMVTCEAACLLTLWHIGNRCDCDADYYINTVIHVKFAFSLFHDCLYCWPMENKSKQVCRGEGQVEALKGCRKKSFKLQCFGNLHS